MNPLEIAREIKRLSADLEQQLNSPPPDDKIIYTEDQLDRAIDNASIGQTLTLHPSLVYEKYLTLSRSIMLKSTVSAIGRIDSEIECPLFMGGLSTSSKLPILFQGLEFRNPNPTVDIGQCYGKDIMFNRCKIRGHELSGAKRGLLLNAENWSVINSIVDRIFRPDMEANGLLTGDMPGPGGICENNFIEASGVSFMSGGQDSSSPDRIPNNITIRRNTFSKNLQWRNNISVKNALEFKCIKKSLVEDNQFINCWGGGQQGYLIVLTTRNQDGTAPWSCIEDVVIRNNYGTNAAAAFNILGRDNNNESSGMRRVLIEGNLFQNLDPVLWTGSDRMILNSASEDVTIQNNIFNGQNIGSTVYLYGQKSDRLRVVNNRFPKSLYGVFCDNGSPNQPLANFNRFVDDGLLEGNVEL